MDGIYAVTWHLFKGCLEVEFLVSERVSERGFSQCNPTERKKLKEGRGVSYPHQLFGIKLLGDSNYPRAGLPEWSRCVPHGSTCSKWVACPPGERLLGTWAEPRASAASRGPQILKEVQKKNRHTPTQDTEKKKKAKKAVLQEAEETSPRMGPSAVTHKSELIYIHSGTARFYPGRTGA